MEMNKLIIFLHIPKTAGSTFQRLAERQYSSREIFHIVNPQIKESIERYYSLPDAQRLAIRFMHGHVFYGIHESFSVPSTYVTILREPIDRVVSHFYFIQRRPRHFLYHTVKERGVNLEMFIRDRMSIEVDNGQVRQLCGLPEPFKSIGYGNVTREMLESAKENLRRSMSVVGITEDFDRTLILFKRTLGWRNPYYYNANVTRNRPPLNGISNGIVELIQESNQFDLELYKYAHQIFIEQIKSQGQAFENEVIKFRESNRTFGKYLAYIQTQFNRGKKAPRKWYARMFERTR